MCREGLQRHPGYLSAHVTLGRALAELGQVTDAEREFEIVLWSAPDNLAALRGLAEIHEAQGHLSQALAFYRRALSLARYDPDLDETVRAIAQELHAPPAENPGLSFAEAQQELIDAAARVPAAPPPPTRVDFDRVLESLGVAPDAPAPPLVEAWLAGHPPSPVTPQDGPLANDKIPSPLPGVSAQDESGAADDLLARLEADLRQLEQRPPPLRVDAVEAGVGDTLDAVGDTVDKAVGVTVDTPVGDTADTPVGDTADKIVLAELERWLTAIAERRQQMRSA